MRLEAAAGWTHPGSEVMKGRGRPCVGTGFGAAQGGRKRIWPRSTGRGQEGNEAFHEGGRPRTCPSSDPQPDIAGPRDVRKFKETKKQFDRVREDMELSLVRNAQAPRHRPHEVEEATGALTLTRKCFRHLALDYVLQVGHWACWVGSWDTAGGQRGDPADRCSLCLEQLLCIEKASDASSREGTWLGCPGKSPEVRVGWGRARGRGPQGQRPLTSLRSIWRVSQQGENARLCPREGPNVLAWGRTPGPWLGGAGPGSGS